MIHIPFTQHMRPTGRQVPTTFPLKGWPESYRDKAQKLIDANCRFESEVLSTNEIHIECQDTDGRLLANFICPNTTEIIENMKNLVNEAYERLK